jgi:hypothetical protein
MFLSQFRKVYLLKLKQFFFILIQIHFDNATGQNKNNVLVLYAIWRTLTG